MKLRLNPLYFAIPLALLSWSSPAVSQGDASPGKGAAGFGGKPKSGNAMGGQAWESLDEEQKRKLREALRDVWTDPAVLSAREEVKVASESYQRAIRNAISKVDPSVAEVLKELQSLNEGRTQERLGGGPGGGPHVRMMPRRGGDYPIGPPSFLENLSEDERERFQKAEKEARESDVVQKVKEELEMIRKEDESLRKRKMEGLRKVRIAVLNEMVQIDPSLEDLRGQLVQTWRSEAASRPKGPSKGAAKGGGAKAQEE